MGEKRGLFKRVLKITGIVLLMLVILLGCFGAFVFLDKGKAAVIDDSDLVAKKMVLDESDNGYTELVKIEKEIKLSSAENDFVKDSLVGERDWDSEKVNQIITKNTEAFSDFDAMVGKSQIMDPSYDPEKVDFSYEIVGLRSSRQMATLQLLKAEQINKQGNSEEAFDEALKVVKFGDQMEKTGPVISYLVGVAIKNMAVDSMTNIVETGNLTPTYKQRKITEIEGYKESSDGLVSGLKDEYAFGKNSIDDIAMGAIGIYGGYSNQMVKLMFRDNFYFSNSQTHKIHAEMFRSMVVQAKEECSSGSSLGISKYTNNKTSTISNIFNRNAMGESIVGLMGKGLESLKTKMCDSEAKFDSLIEKMGN